MKIDMDYQPRPIYDVIAKLPGTNDNEWVILGNHHDAWVFGAADPGSGTASMLEAARSLGELVRSGWKPRRSILMCEWDAEEPGLIGSTLWVEENRAELQAKAVAYINTDVGVTGPNFSAAATPSLKSFIRDVTREVEDPSTKHSVYDSWRGHLVRSGEDVGSSRHNWKTEGAGEAPLGALGAGSDFSPFFDYAGIPSVDIGFGGDYGVYHSLYDDFYWMKHFGDPTFGYHAALARILGTIALRLDEADILPFDYSAYATEISRMESDLLSRASSQAGEAAALKPVAEASIEFTTAASRSTAALRDLGSITRGSGDSAGTQSRARFRRTGISRGKRSGRPPVVQTYGLCAGKLCGIRSRTHAWCERIARPQGPGHLEDRSRFPVRGPSARGQSSGHRHKPGPRSGSFIAELR